MAEKERYQGDERRETTLESTLSVRWWCVLLVFLGIFGYFFVSIVNHETRITRAESKYESIAEMRQDIKEIKNMMIKNNGRQ
jgi:hypothetical protein